MNLPVYFEQALEFAHPSWRPTLHQALLLMQTKSPDYLSNLAQDDFLPEGQRIFAAFSVPLDQVRYVLVGEGPYPRASSANGYCFMDAAVGSLWSSEAKGGLSKPVNRATSLRNFMKMLLLAEGVLSEENLNPTSMAEISIQARAEGSGMIQTMADLHRNFVSNGFLMLNASLVFRSHVAPSIDAKAWEIFLKSVFDALSQLSRKPTVILWGKIADRLSSINSLSHFELARSEHPYNLSFITNKAMQALFAPLALLVAR
jgi:uracil-DNA glycosylase